MRIAFPMALFSSLLGGTSSAQVGLPLVDPPQSFHALSATDIADRPVSMDRYKGHKVLVVNTASRCGFTPQYAKLEELYQRYASSGLIILGFPSNNFLWQEPGSNAEIGAFCSREYGVSFPMMGKVDVKGKDMHPVYQWLTSKARNGVSDNTVKWNFQKYLIDEQGRLIGTFAPGTDPLSEEIVSLIRPAAEVVQP